MRKVFWVLGLGACIGTSQGRFGSEAASFSDTGLMDEVDVCEMVSALVVDLAEGDRDDDHLAKIVEDLPGQFEGEFFHGEGSVPAVWVVDNSLGEVRLIQMEGPGTDCQDHYELGFGVSLMVEGWIDARFTTVMEIVPGGSGLYEVGLPNEAMIGPMTLVSTDLQQALLLEGSYESGAWLGVVNWVGEDPRPLGSFVVAKVD